MSTATDGNARVLDSVAKTQHDHLLLPDGRACGDVKDVTAELVALCIPGASYSSGRAANIERYRVFLEAIRAAAGDKAEKEWRTFAAAHGDKPAAEEFVRQHGAVVSHGKPQRLR